jgi:ketosteroid isomerase-like protein
MAQLNLESWREAYRGVSGGNFEKAFELIDPAVEIRDRPESPDAGTYHGYEGVVRAVRVSEETFDELQFQAEHFFTEGNRVVVVVRLTGRGKQSGVPFEERVAHLWTVRNGRGTLLQVYTDPDDALAAAGISQRLGASGKVDP